MFAYSLILSTRLRPIEWLFNGLAKLYDAHRWFGKMAFCLILMHVFFLSLKFGSGYRGGLGNLWLSDYWPVRWGLVAFYGMSIALLGSTLIRMKHQTFIKLHSLLGGFFVVGAYHGFAMNAQLKAIPALRYYMLVLIGLASVAYVYHTVLGKWLIKRYKYIVQDVHLLKDNIVEIILTPKWRPISFTPGQFGFVSFNDPAVDNEAHPFGLASHPNQRLLRIVVKDLGDYTGKLDKLSRGSQVKVEGPFGSFSYLNAKLKRQVWIAGGIGITPFLSMAQSLAADRRKQKRYHIDFFYCTKTKGEAVFTAEMKKLAQQIPNFTVHLICEASDGFLTAETIAKNSGGLAKKEFFICGPLVMMQALNKQLTKSGVEPELIEMEEFKF